MDFSHWPTKIYWLFNKVAYKNDHGFVSGFDSGLSWSVLNVDSEATIDTVIAKIPLAILLIIGYLLSLTFHHKIISNLECFSWTAYDWSSDLDFKEL